MNAVENETYEKNQCSLVIRIDGEAIEIPVTFGMTSDEIRMIYPFVLPLVNQKIENPAIQFSRMQDQGLFSDLTDEEYRTELQRVVAQSKFWYDKPYASLLDVAVRFAVDIKMKGVSELNSVFVSTQTFDPIRTKPVSKDEADIIMRRLNIEATEDDMKKFDYLKQDESYDDLSDIEYDTTDKSASTAAYSKQYEDIYTPVSMPDKYKHQDDDVDVEYDASGDEEEVYEDVEEETSFDARSTRSNIDYSEIKKSFTGGDNTNTAHGAVAENLSSASDYLTQALDSVESSVMADESYTETAAEDFENIDADRYSLKYDSTAKLTDEQIKDGLLVRDDDVPYAVEPVEEDASELVNDDEDEELIPVDDDEDAALEYDSSIADDEPYHQSYKNYEEEDTEEFDEDEDDEEDCEDENPSVVDFMSSDNDDEDF